MPGQFHAQGQALDARFFDRLASWVLTRIEAGTGIRLTRMNGKIVINVTAVGGARGGGDSAIPWVKELPPIPTSAKTTMTVFWAGSDRMEDGTGDNQKWTASTGDDRWRPETKVTTLSGEPGEE